MADLYITALDPWMLREPVSHRGYCVLRLRAKSGLAGFGECGEVSAAEIETARRAITGRPATSFEDVRIRLASTPRARAGINMAMLDLVGKFTKAPVYLGLGGPTRHRARALASLDGAADDDLVASLKTRNATAFRAFAVPPRQAAHSNGSENRGMEARQRQVRSVRSN
jgi:galactonate dehydratase